MKINFNVNLKDLQGQEIQNANIKNMLANAIVAQEAKDNILQKFELAKKIACSDDDIEITTSEKNIIEEVLTQSKFNVLASAQILELMSNSKN